MHETLQREIDHFIEHHVMSHGTSVFGMSIDSFMLILIPALLISLAFALRFRISRVPHGLLCAAEAYVVFIRDHIVYSNFGVQEGRRFVSFFCTLFLFVASANLLGLVPAFAAITGNLSVTAALALIFLSVTLGGALYLRGPVKTFHAFIPSGLPPALKPFMFIMEAVSLFARAFALAIRLFGNMLAGHIVIYSLLSLVLLFGYAASPALLMVVIMYCFETFVALLQAYIFTLLSAIFMNMIINPGH